MRDERPLIAHVVYRFDTGGLENGIVNLINHMDEAAFRHAVVALTEVTDFSKRIRRRDVEFVSLHKPAGHAWAQFGSWARALKKLQPDIVHTRNLGALELQASAWWAGVPVRLHGEHGRDMRDPRGERVAYRWIRRLYAPLVHRQVALNSELADYLRHQVGLSEEKVLTLRNGVDTQRFAPVESVPPIRGCPFDPRVHLIIGTVGRQQAEKDPMTLLQAFAALHGIGAAHAKGAGGDRLACARLVMVGQGPERAALDKAVLELGLQDRVWMAGERADIPEVLAGLHVFALPSRAEGLSNTLLEAMACGLAVVATRVGGNTELVQDGTTGWLVPSAEPGAMAQALSRLMLDDGQRVRMGRQGRERVVQEFSLRAMVAGYQSMYEAEWSRRGGWVRRLFSAG